MSVIENFIINNYFVVFLFNMAVLLSAFVFMFRFVSRQENGEKIGALRILGAVLIVVVLFPYAFWEGSLIKNSESPNDLTWQQSFQYSENAFINNFRHHQEPKKTP